MSKCIKIDFPTSEICISDLRFRIDIFPHTIVPPQGNNPEYTIDKDPVISRWAAIKTTPNAAIFDAANTEVAVTHDFFMRFTPQITSEQWVRLKGNFYRILHAENVQEVDTVLRLRTHIWGVEP